MPAQDFRLAGGCSANPVAQHSKDPANDSPSPGGEGRGEDGRSNHFCSNSKIHTAGGSPVSARRSAVESAAEACVRSLWGRVDEAVGNVLQTVTLDDLGRQAGGSEALDFTI